MKDVGIVIAESQQIRFGEYAGGVDLSREGWKTSVGLGMGG